MPERGHLSRCIDCCAGAKWHSAKILPEFGPSEAATSREAFCSFLGSCFCVAEGLLLCTTVLLSGLQDTLTAAASLDWRSYTQLAPCD